MPFVDIDSDDPQRVTLSQASESGEFLRTGVAGFRVLRRDRAEERNPRGNHPAHGSSSPGDGSLQNAADKACLGGSIWLSKLTFNQQLGATFWASHSAQEVGAVTFINTNGMAFIGPGSEWFWTAASGLILVVTFLAIYRQLRIARDANSYDQLVAFQQDVWSERMVRVELDLLLALRDSADPADVPPGVGDIIGGFWQQTGALARSGHLDPKLLRSGALDGVTFWWSALAPWTRRYRVERTDPGYLGSFEWLADQVAEWNRREGAPASAHDRAEVIALLEDRLRIEEALRTVIVASPDRPLVGHARHRHSQRPSPPSAASHSRTPTDEFG